MVDATKIPSGQKEQALGRLFESMDDTGECEIPDAGSWLGDNEELKEFTRGHLVQPTSEFDHAVVLTSKYLRAVSVCEEMKIKLSDIGYVRWAGLWARLNVGVRSPEKRLVFAISGREWKKRAKSLAKEWSRL